MCSMDLLPVNMFHLLPDEVVIHILSFQSTAELKRIALVSKRFNRLCFDFWTKMALPEKAKLSQTDAFNFLAKCVRLTELNLNRRERDEDAMNLAIHALKSVSTLRRLKVNYCPLSLLKTISRSNSLRALTVMCWDSEDNLMECDTPSLAYLKELNLMFCSPNSMEAMGNYCLNLDILSIGPGIYGKNMVSLVGAIGSNLKELNIYEICDRTFEIVLLQCPLLEKLEIESTHLSGPNYQKIFSGLKKLKNLKLGNCWKLDDDGMSALADNCKEITELTLFGCNFLTEVGIKHVLVKCDQLKYLHFRHMDCMAYNVVKEVKPKALEYIIWDLVDIPDVGNVITPMQWKVDFKLQSAGPQLVPYQYPFTSARY